MPGGFDDGAHRAFRSRHSRISAVAMNLIAAEFGLRLFASHHDSSSGGVDLNRVPVCDFGRHHEEVAEHLDHVLITMIVIVQQDDVEERCKPLIVSWICRRLYGSNRRCDCGARRH